MNKIFSLSISVMPGSEATSEQRAWIVNHYQEIKAAIVERVESKVIELISMEINYMGFSKQFPQQL